MPKYYVTPEAAVLPESQVHVSERGQLRGPYGYAHAREVSRAVAAGTIPGSPQAAGGTDTLPPPSSSATRRTARSLNRSWALPPKMGGTALGFVACIIGIIVLDTISVTHVDGIGVSLGQGNALCESTLGQLAQGFDQTAATDCGTVSTLMDLHGLFVWFAWLSGIALVLMIALAMAGSVAAAKATER